MVYETTINPGEGLGSMIKLGTSLYEVTNQLSKFKYKLRINYSDKQFLQEPIVVDVVEVGVRLTFLNQEHQSLVLIELLRVNDSKSTPLKLVYNNISLNEIQPRTASDCSAKNSVSSLVSENSNASIESYISLGPSLKAIYNKIFGPTYPGDLHRNSYIISYPGISFNFKLSSDLYEKVSSLDKQAILSYLLNCDDEIICDSIALYNGDSWTDFNNGNTKTVTNYDSIQDLKVNLDKGEITINFLKDSKQLIIGETTQQQVLNILGPPDDYFNKFDCRLLIHKHSKDLQLTADKQLQDNDITHYKFHNYYKYGIDILYDLNGENTKVQNKTTIKKIILHNGGICESLNFMKWNRCNWEIYNKAIRFNSSMTFNELPEVLRDLTPVILNRNEAEFVDNDLDIIDVPKDVIFKQGSQNSINSLEEKVKTWGQSKLYGFDNCIFEVVDSNGTISSITIY